MSMCKHLEARQRLNTHRNTLFSGTHTRTHKKIHSPLLLLPLQGEKRREITGITRYRVSYAHRSSACSPVEAVKCFLGFFFSVYSTRRKVKAPTAQKQSGISGSVRSSRVLCVCVCVWILLLPLPFFFLDHLFKCRICCDRCCVHSQTGISQTQTLSNYT